MTGVQTCALPICQNFWLEGKTTVSTLFPILTGEEIAGVAIENLVLDGNREKNEHLDGNYAGCVFLQDCQRISMRGIEARNYNGDGLSWQICHDVIVENCHSHHHAGLGLHPGSGSQRPIMRKNRLEANQIGIFFCWGVKFGLADENTVVGNKCGISIGHRDTDNVITGNTIRESGDVGVLFRPERGKAFAPHRNRLVRNTIENNGPDASAAVDVQGETEACRFSRTRSAIAAPIRAASESGSGRPRARLTWQPTRSPEWRSKSKTCDPGNKPDRVVSGNASGIE